MREVVGRVVFMRWTYQAAVGGRGRHGCRYHFSALRVYSVFLNCLHLDLFEHVVAELSKHHFMHYTVSNISEKSRRKFGGWMERLKFQAFIEELIPPLETQFIIVLVFEDKIHTPQCGVGGKGRKRRHCRRRNFGTDGRPTTNDRNHRCSKRSLRT